MFTSNIKFDFCLTSNHTRTHLSGVSRYDMHICPKGGNRVRVTVSSKAISSEYAEGISRQCDVTFLTISSLLSFRIFSLFVLFADCLCNVTRLINFREKIRGVACCNVVHAVPRYRGVVGDVIGKQCPEGIRFKLNCLFC